MRVAGTSDGQRAAPGGGIFRRGKRVKGMDAMTSNSLVARRLSQLWQIPLLLVAVALFLWAAWLFIDPKPGLSLDQKIDIASFYLTQERPEAALEQLNRLLNTERVDQARESRIHLLLAEALEQGQKQKKINIAANHTRIIEQTQIALSQGAKPTGEIYRRLGESYEALERPVEALAYYRQAIAMDPAHALRLQRKVIDLQLAENETAAAEGSLDHYLKQKISDAERAWAVGEKAQILADNGNYLEARTLLNDALRLEQDPVNQGVLNYRLGYCAWKLRESPEAERLLRLSRQQMRTQHPLDGQAAYVLGKIFQDRADAPAALSFYQSVLVIHPDSPAAPLARLNRGLCRLMEKDDEAGLSDLHDLVGQLNQKTSLIERYRQEVLAVLRQGQSLLMSRGAAGGAIELLAYEQSLEPHPKSSFYARLGAAYESRAEQFERSLADAPAAEQVKRTQQARDARISAADAYIAYSRSLVLSDDKGYGQALWRGVDLYDRAGDLQRVAAALDLFVTERPEDPLAPDALLRLGRTWQAAGQFDRAIAAFVKNQFRYPNALAASKSAVPLAQAYMAKGPEFYPKAEKALLSVIRDNPLVTPQAEEFSQSLFELGQLYYRTGRYEEAVNRLEEWTQRYPNDQRTGQLYFLMADSYRKSAALLESQATSVLTTQPATNEAGVMNRAEASAARKRRLELARGLYDKVIDLYRAAAPAGEMDRLYMKLSHFYRADCLYDLGEYAEAIKLYDTAAFRYQDDPSSLAAYVQIVNSYCALGKVAEAKTANERAKWLLRRMPSETFADGSYALPKAYWEQWLKWTSESGMW